MGYLNNSMAAHQSELRIPADPAFIVVAKRAAAGFASVAGLHVEAVDDVVIAVAQACEHAIGRLRRVAGEGVGQLRLEFSVRGQQLDVQVRSTCTRAEVEAAQLRQAEAARHQAEVSRRRAQQRLDEAELALQLMGLFVDDFGYRLDDRTGAIRVRLTKYAAS